DDRALVPPRGGRERGDASKNIRKSYPGRERNQPAQRGSADLGVRRAVLEPQVFVALRKQLIDQKSQVSVAAAAVLILTARRWRVLIKPLAGVVDRNDHRLLDLT